MHTLPVNEQSPIGGFLDYTFPPAGYRLSSPPLPLVRNILQMPVLPYVAKYLAATFPNGYRLSDSEATGELLTQLLRASKHKKFYDGFSHRYTAAFTVILPAGKSRNGVPGKVTSYTAVRFNAFVDAQIRLRMYDFVDFCKQYRVMKKAAAIREFMAKYGFSEEDIAYETLLKAYQRHEWRTQKESPAG